MTTAAQEQAALIQRQDELRPVRQFLSLVSGITGDQSYGYVDGLGVNPPGQFQTYGPYGQAVEGQPIMSYSSTGGVTIAPVLVMLGMGLVAYMIWK